MARGGLLPYNGRLEKCNRRGCVNFVVAKPILVLPAPPPNEKHQIRVRLNLPVCRGHMSTKVRLYLSADGKREIMRFMLQRKLEEPRWKKAWIEFEPIGLK